MTTRWLCPSHWHATNLCAEVIHQRLWHLSELKEDEGIFKINVSKYDELNTVLLFLYPFFVHKSETLCTT